MKQAFKISMATAAISTAALFSACNSSNGANLTDTHEQHNHFASHNADEDTYTCPMHPEVRGKKGDTCPKCGMKLEYNDNAAADTKQNISMQFKTSAATINANQEVTLSFIPKIKDKPQEQVALDIEHEKKIHLILVNDDLSWFDHIHPEFDADGSYIVTEKFPAPGRYTLFADYKPSGGNHIVDQFTVPVLGQVAPVNSYNAEKLSGESGNFKVVLSPVAGKLFTGAPMQIHGTVSKDGKNIDPNTLENYLATKAHMVVIGLSDKQYLHVHPGVTNGKFDLHTTFEKPGIYRGWIQFQSEGKLHTVDFTMHVTEGTQDDLKMMSQIHQDGHHGMEHHQH